MKAYKDLKAERGDTDMKTQWRRIAAGMIYAAAMAAVMVVSGCGKKSSVDIPKYDESFQVYWEGSAVTPEGENGPVIRANGRDTMKVYAALRGSTSNIVNFFLPATFATFPGCTTTEGWCSSYISSKTGYAAVVVQSTTVAGRTELLVTSDAGEASLLVTFDYATLTLFPSVLVLNGTDSTQAIVEARGGLTPIEWWVSHPQQVGFHIRDETSVVVYTQNISDPLTGATSTPPEPMTLTARDAEGSTATANIYTSTTNCTAASLNVTPTGAANGNNATVSITLEDFDMRDASSVTVTAYSSILTIAPQTFTLTPWLVPGVFQATVSLSDPGAASTTTIEYADTGTGCQGNSVTATFTWT